MAQFRRQTQVEQGDPSAAQEADVTRMQVGVDEAVDERHLAKHLDTQRRHLARIDSSRGRVPFPALLRAGPW